MLFRSDSSPGAGTQHGGGPIVIIAGDSNSTSDGENETMELMGSASSHAMTWMNPQMSATTFDLETAAGMKTEYGYDLYRISKDMHT